MAKKAEMWPWALCGVLVIALIALGMYIWMKTDKICMTRDSFEKLNTCSMPLQQKNYVRDTVRQDYRVLNDPLKSPTNRSDTMTESELRREVDVRNLYVNTRPEYDTFRLVGYLTSSDAERDAGGNSWKLFARERDRQNAEFYIVPANNNYDIKLMITGDMSSPRLRDVYSISDSIVFNSPMLNKGAYTFVEVPKQAY